MTALKQISLRLTLVSVYAYFSITTLICLIPFVANAAPDPLYDNHALAEPPLPLQDIFYRSLAEEDYQQATRLIGSLGAMGTESHPWADLWRASLIIAQQIDFGDTLGTAAYLRASERAIRDFGDILDEGDMPDTLRASILEALGSLEMLEAQRLREVEGHTLASLAPGGRAVDRYREAYDLDPKRLQARAGILLYDFWKSHALRAFAWTPFVRDRRSESLAGLTQLLHVDHPVRHSVGPGLAWALIEVDKPAKAAALADSLLSTSGEIRGLLEPAGKAYFLLGRWEEAEDRYGRLVESIREQERRNVVREIGALHRLGHIEAALERWDRVVEVSDAAQALELTQQQRERKRDDLERLASLKKDALRNLGESRD